MCYLYDMYIAHLDLKSNNILFNIVEKEIMNKTTKCVDIKLIDFRMSKVDVGRNPKTTNNNNFYNSVKYMALEVLRNKLESIKL